MNRLVLVARLKPEATAAAAELVAHGPPFDPEERGLSRHGVFVSAGEVIFVFEAPEVMKESPAAKLLVLSMQDDPRYVREAFAAGAAGYVLKEAADNELVQAVREVAGGASYVHPALGARLAGAEAEERRRAEEDPLSEREREVMRLLALGHTNQEIAKMLYISVRTAETHRAHIMQKLRLQTRAELVRYAIAQGLLNEAEA